MTREQLALWRGIACGAVVSSLLWYALVTVMLRALEPGLWGGLR